MAKNLVIVESPAKAKTISRFLGKGFKVLASMGHVRDLPKSKMGVDIEHDFEPVYEVTVEKKKVVSSLRKEFKDADELWIATDEDREGEAIGWHLLEALKVPKTKKAGIKRIVFHEITEGAIKEAMKNPRTIDQRVVDAQQARRILDRLVGYELSPLLWKKVRYGLSAGRVQSVAVRLIVDRERAIEAFEPEEYWKILGDFVKGKDGFQAELQRYLGKKLKVTSEKQSKEVLSAIKGADYQVVSVEKKQTKKNPAPPFITSTLQQEASRKLGFSVKKTMMVAQRLYEGMDLGSGAVGLITYMRTDSVNLSNVALKAAKELIEKQYGKEYALSSPRRYKGRKGAQEAHEAIRPVDLTKGPSMMAKFLDKDQFRLYELIWKRTVACQMKEAILDKTAVDIGAFKGDEATGYEFRATGQVVKFSGFMEVYMEGKDVGEEESLGNKFLPNLEEGDDVDLRRITPSQHFTKPPARYTEASLVKKLEAEGIGRPSTYAPTISTIISRGYIEKEAKTLRPTDIAMVVTDLLVEHFSKIVDYKFTAKMEDDLDEIEEGEKEWVPVIKEFYGPFHEKIVEKEESLKKENVLKERDLGVDPKSGLNVVVRHGRFGSYVQLGKWTKEQLDELEEKPKRASLPDGTYFETIEIKDALKALELPRDLGKMKNGDRVIVLVGRFGPYLKVGKTNVSLPKGFDPHTVMLGDVDEIIKESLEQKKKMLEPIKTFEADPVSGGVVLVKNGRFGPYVTDGKTNASLPKAVVPEDITFEEATALLEKKRKAPKRGRGGWSKKK